jgi:hypothetical protein
MPWIKDEDGAPILVAEDSAENKIYDHLKAIDIKIEQNHNQAKKMKNAKITSCVYSREWEGPSGKIYYHNITLDNGDEGSVGTKEKMPSKICTGAEIYYSIESKGQFKGKTQYNIKLEKAPDQQYRPSTPQAPTKYQPSQQENIARSVALKAAVDAIGAGEKAEVYVDMALYFEHYLNTGQQANQDAVDNALNDRKMDSGFIQNFREEEIRGMENDLPF